MSTVQQLDKWDKLSRLLQSVTDEKLEQMKADLDVDEVCVNGLARSVDSTIRRFSSLLKMMGFDSKEIYKRRQCVVNGCPYDCASLPWMLNHFIGYHEIPIKNIARMVPAIKSDTRKPELSFKNTIQTLHMNTD